MSQFSTTIFTKQFSKVIEGINVLDLIIILGAIQGIFFVGFLWAKPLNNKRANVFLSLFILGFAFSSVYYTLETIGVRGFLTVWDFSPLYCPLLIIAALHLFVRALLKPDKKIDLLGWILLGLSALQLCWQLWWTYCTLIDRESVIAQKDFIFAAYSIFDLLLLGSSLVVFFNSSNKIILFDKTLQHNYADIDDFSLKWLNRLFFFLLGILVLFTLPALYELITAYTAYNMYYPMWIASSILIYWIGYSTYFRNANRIPEIYHTNKDAEDNKLSDNTRAYHQKLNKLMFEEKVYLDQSLNLKMLADKLGLSSGYLSQIINEYEKKNFFDYINAYRVEEVKSKIVDPSHQHLNLLGIAYESGFKSKSTFNLAFKKHTKMTPSAYKRSLSS